MKFLTWKTMLKWMIGIAISSWFVQSLNHGHMYHFSNRAETAASVLLLARRLFDCWLGAFTVGLAIFAIPRWRERRADGTSSPPDALAGGQPEPNSPKLRDTLERNDRGRNGFVKGTASAVP
jgi:hypothetical protein